MRGKGLWRRLGEIRGYVASSCALFDTRPPQIIIAVGLHKTVLAGWLLKRRWGVPLIVELAVLPGQLVRCRDERRSPVKALRAWWADRVASAVLRGADHVKVIFPDHLRRIRGASSKIRASSFPDFVPVHAISPCHEEHHVLLLGTPLFLKGADLAIRAFQALRARFPGERLLIVGSRVGFPALERLLTPHDAVQLIDYVPPPVALDYVRRAKVVLIPSRTDAMPRVAVEAMAAAKAVVAARVDGVSHYLRDDRNSLLCQPGDHLDLAAKLATLLANAGLRRRLGEQARRDAVLWFDEVSYAARYRTMVDDCLADRQGAAFNVP